MDWTQSLTIIISNFGVLLVLFVYLLNRMDVNQKQTNEKMDSNQKQTNEKFNALENRMTKMESDMQSTNQRITDLKTDINQRLSTIEGYLVPKKVYHIQETEHVVDEPKEN